MRTSRSYVRVVVVVVFALSSAGLTFSDVETPKHDTVDAASKKSAEKSVVANSEQVKTSDKNVTKPETVSNHENVKEKANNENKVDLTSKVVSDAEAIDADKRKKNENENQNVSPSTSDDQSTIGRVTELNSGALLRGFYVFVGLSIVALAYMVFRSSRLNKNRTQIVRKYGVLAHKQDIEMRPLPLDDDEDDDTTVFDASGLVPPRSQP